MVAGMQRIIRETGAEYTNCYLHICTDTVLRNCNIFRFGNRELLQIFLQIWQGVVFLLNQTIFLL